MVTVKVLTMIFKNVASMCKTLKKHWDMSQR